MRQAGTAQCRTSCARQRVQQRRSARAVWRQAAAPPQRPGAGPAPCRLLSWIEEIAADSWLRLSHVGDQCAEICVGTLRAPAPAGHGPLALAHTAHQGIEALALQRRPGRTVTTLRRAGTGHLVAVHAAALVQPHLPQVGRWQAVPFAAPAACPHQDRHGERPPPPLQGRSWSFLRHAQNLRATDSTRRPRWVSRRRSPSSVWNSVRSLTWVSIQSMPHSKPQRRCVRPMR